MNKTNRMILSHSKRSYMYLHVLCCPEKCTNGRNKLFICFIDLLKMIIDMNSVPSFHFFISLPSTYSFSSSLSLDHYYITEKWCTRMMHTHTHTLTSLLLCSWIVCVLIKCSFIFIGAMFSIWIINTSICICTYFMG